MSESVQVVREWRKFQFKELHSLYRSLWAAHMTHGIDTNVMR